MTLNKSFIHRFMYSVEKLNRKPLHIDTSFAKQKLKQIHLYFLTFSTHIKLCADHLSLLTEERADSIKITIA